MFSTLVRIGTIVLLFCVWRRRPPGLIKNVFLILAVANLIIVPFTFAALWQRVREIERGELDEARKY